MIDALLKGGLATKTQRNGAITTPLKIIQTSPFVHLQFKLGFTHVKAELSLVTGV